MIFCFAATQGLRRRPASLYTVPVPLALLIAFPIFILLPYIFISLMVPVISQRINQRSNDYTDAHRKQSK